MDEKRKEQIALILIKEQIRTTAYKFDAESIKRNANNLARETKIPIKEIIEFYQKTMSEVMAESFKKAKT